jgi:hypothetical protein
MNAAVRILNAFVIAVLLLPETKKTVSVGIVLRPESGFVKKTGSLPFSFAGMIQIRFEGSHLSPGPFSHGMTERIGGTPLTEKLHFNDEKEL